MTGSQRQEYVRIFNDSYERLMYGPKGDSGAFFESFYQQLTGTNAEAAAKFEGVEMSRQVRMLRASVAVLLNYFATGGESEALRVLAERHGRAGADIPPRLYEAWLECLIETVRRFDKGFDAEVEAAWRMVFSKGVEYMISRYEGARGASSGA